MTTNEASRVMVVSYVPLLSGEPGLTMPSGFFLRLFRAFGNARPPSHTRCFALKDKDRKAIPVDRRTCWSRRYQLGWGCPFLLIASDGRCHQGLICIV